MISISADLGGCGKRSDGAPVVLVHCQALQGAEEGTNRWAVEHNWVSVTRHRLDLIAEKDLARALALHHTPAISTTTRSKSAKKKRKHRVVAR